MKVKITELLSSVPVLETLLQQRLNGAIAFKVHEIIREVKHRLNSFNESKTKILESHEAVLDDDKTEYTFPSDEHKEKADKEYAELINTEVEIPARQLTMHDLERIPAISAEELNYISWIIESN